MALYLALVVLSWSWLGVRRLRMVGFTLYISAGISVRSSSIALKHRGQP